MDRDIEKIAKEALLTFFFEASETYVASLNALDLCYISRWLSKIYQEDVYTMRTHLLLLYNQVRQGQLTLPFCIDPEEVKLIQFRPVPLFPPGCQPTRNQMLRLLVRRPETATATAPDDWGACTTASCPAQRFEIPQRCPSGSSRSRSYTRNMPPKRHTINRRCVSSDRVYLSKHLQSLRNGSRSLPIASTARKTGSQSPHFPLSPVRRRLCDAAS